MGSLGISEMMAIFVVALLLFGPKKLPELGRTLGKALTEFRRAKNELKATFESHLSELDREVNLQQTASLPPASYSSPDYSYTQDYGSYESDYHSPSVSHEANGTHEASTSQPTTASATATSDAEAHRDQPSSHESAVAGTVARSTGVQPADSGSVATEETHSA